MSASERTVTAVQIDLPNGLLQASLAGPLGAPPIAAAHPADPFTAGTAQLVAATADTGVLCLNPRGLGGSSPAVDPSLEAMADDLEAARQQLGLPPWVFWGMSGGGWLGLLYAHRHPAGLVGLVVESACLCFRARLADPACVLSPSFPAWRPALEAAGRYSERAHDAPRAPEELVWRELSGVGAILCELDGPAVGVSPGPLSADMARTLPVLYGFDARPWAASLDLPVLVLAGGADPLVPVAHSRAMQAAIPGARLVVVEGASHVPTAAGAPEVAQAVRAFLAELRGAG